MAVINSIKSTLCVVADTVSNVAHNYVEKNRTKAKLNRLRMVMKSESELMNRAYIALGKDYYEVLKSGNAEPNDRQQKLMKVIDNSKAKIARARDCYRKVLESQNAFLYGTSTAEAKPYEGEAVADITVACSNESDYNSNPFTAEAADGAVQDDESPAEELF